MILSQRAYYNYIERDVIRAGVVFKRTQAVQAKPDLEKGPSIHTVLRVNVLK